MSRVRALVYRNRKIIFVNYRLCPRGRYLGVLNDLVKALEKKPDRSARILTDMDKAYYEPALVLQWRAQLKLLSAKLNKSAIFGCSPLARISIQGFLLAASLSGFDLGGRIALFDTRKDAMQWLMLD
jgi:hypothetical protein